MGEWAQGNIANGHVLVLAENGLAFRDCSHYLLKEFGPFFGIFGHVFRPLGKGQRNACLLAQGILGGHILAVNGKNRHQRDNAAHTGPDDNAGQNDPHRRDNHQQGKGNKKTDAADKFVPHGKSSEICGVAAFGKTENRHQKNGQDKCRAGQGQGFFARAALEDCQKPGEKPAEGKQAAGVFAGQQMQEPGFRIAVVRCPAQIEKIAENRKFLLAEISGLHEGWPEKAENRQEKGKKAERKASHMRTRACFPGF